MLLDRIRNSHKPDGDCESQLHAAGKVLRDEIHSRGIKNNALHDGADGSSTTCDGHDAGCATHERPHTDRHISYGGQCNDVQDDSCLAPGTDSNGENDNCAACCNDYATPAASGCVKPATGLGDASGTTADECGDDTCGADAGCNPEPMQYGMSDSYSDLISASDMQQLDNRELVDMDRLVWIAEYLAAKHADKKNMRAVMGPLVDTIRSSADSIQIIQDDVHELLLSAQTSLERLKDVHVEMCEGHEEYAAARTLRGPVASSGHM